MSATAPVDLFAQPLDTVWLRDGKPFTAGEASADPGAFPPSPWTWQGMIRTRMLVGAYGDGLRRVPQPQVEQDIGAPDRLPAGWRIWGPLPAERRGAVGDGEGPVQLLPWVPTPSFLALKRTKSSGRPGCLSLESRSRSLMPYAGGALSSSPPQHVGGHLELMGHLGGAKGAAGGWISVQNLMHALLGQGRWEPAGASNGEKRAQGGADLPPFVCEERRPGLTVDAEGRAADGGLFFATHHRFEDGAGLWGAVEGAPHRLSQHLIKGGAALGRKERLVELRAAALPDGWLALLRGEAALAAPVDRPLDLRVVLITAALRAEGPPIPLPTGVELRGLEARSGPDIGGFDRYGSKAGRASQPTLGAGTSLWLRLPAAERDARTGQLRAILGLDPASLTEAERLGFGQRVGAPFDPCSGEPTTGGPHGH